VPQLRDEIRKIWETVDQPFNALWLWAKKPDDPERRAERWAALARWASEQRSKAKPGSADREKWAEKQTIYETKAEQNQRNEAGDPEIVGWEETDIAPSAVFGGLGPELKVTTHYAASPRAETLDEGINFTRSFDAYHRSLGWGGLSYHYLIPDTGEIILGRRALDKGAHVLNTNSNNVGINFFCTTGHQPTEAQAKSYLWLLANAHTDKLPPAHRTDRDLREADIRGHKFWPGQSTDCPGYFTPDNLKKVAA
jgi:hypothetical protein